MLQKLLQNVSREEKALLQLQRVLQRLPLKGKEYENNIEILNLKIANLTVENTRQVKEIENTKRSLESASQQLKDIAVKVIESSNQQQKTAPTT